MVKAARVLRERMKTSFRTHMQVSVWCLPDVAAFQS